MNDLYAIFGFVFLYVSFLALVISFCRRLWRRPGFESRNEADEPSANIPIQKFMPGAQTSNFDFPVNVPNLTRDDRIAIAAFFATPVGKLFLLRLQATLCNNALAAGANKQFAGARASEAYGYSECLMQIKSLSVVPTASDIPAPVQEDGDRATLNKFPS